MSRTASASASLAAVPISGERVHRLGGILELDGRLSWAPADVRGWQPCSCYLVQNDRGAVLIDTGVRVHEQVVLDQLRSLLRSDVPLSIVLTRTELDCCLNVPAIERVHPVQHVWYTGGITVPTSRAEVRRVNIAEGGTTDLEVVPGLTLEILAPRLRLLPTLWVYDAVSKVLFTSDTFGHARSEDDRGNTLLSDASEAPGWDAVEAQLLLRLGWMQDADIRAIKENFGQMFKGRDVAAIAPSHGRVLVGSEVVRHQRELMADVLRKVGRP